MTIDAACAVDDILDLALELLEVPLAALALASGETRWRGAVPIPAPDVFGRACAAAAERDGVAAAPDPDPQRDAALAACGLAFLAGAALRDGSGTTLGTLWLCDRAPRPQGLDRRARLQLGALADHAAARLELDRARSDNATLRRALADHAAARLELDRAHSDNAALRRALADSGAAAREQVGRLDALLSAAPVGICYAGQDGGLLLSNAELERLWGAFPRSGSVDDYVEWQGWWADGSARHGQAVGAHEWPLARALRGERVDGDVIQIQPFDGSPRRTVMVHAAPVLDADGAVRGAVIAVSEITRQAEIEQALRLNEERFRSLVQSSAQIVWIADPSGQFAIDAASWQAVTGQDAAQSAGAGWLDAMHPDDRARAAAAWSASTATRAPYEAEYRMRLADGSYRWTVARGHPIVDADGAVREWVGTAADIHDRRVAEDASREWRRRLETILDAGDIGTWTLDLRDDRLQADDNLARLFGVAPARVREAPLQAFLAAVHPDDVAAVKASLTRAVEYGEPHQLVHRVRGPGGSELTVNARGRVEYDAAGVPLRLCGVVLDVTRQVETERRLRSSESARLRGEQRYRTVLDSIDVGFCVIEMIFDADGEPWDYRILETNPAFVQHTGLEDASGKTIREMIPTHDVRWSRIYARVARSGLPVRVEQHTANLGRWLDVYAARIGEPGRFQVAVFLRDITEERQRNERLRRLADDLADANRRQSEFLATLAHELRNPLAPVRTGLDLLRIGADKPGVLAKVRPMMERQVNHLVNLVDDLLDLARINSGKVELKKCDVALKDVILRAVEMTLPAIEAKRHDFALELADEETRLHADPTRLAQVVGNLLTNAAKYTMEGGTIRLQARRVADGVRIAVSDSGIGIPPDSLPRIFDMFTQVGRHPEQEAGGLGIGLHLVRQMTERHGGSVRAESGGPGRGSCFTVELPVAGSAPPGDGAAAGGAAAGRARALRILLADDNADAVELLREALQLEGHTVHAVGNGMAALEAAAWFAPDVAFLDIGMPGLNGHEVARRLRALPGAGAALPVAVTGWGTEQDRLRSREAGFDAHLTKPVDLDSLRALVAGAA